MTTTTKYAGAAGVLFLVGAFIAVQVLSRQPLPTTSTAAKSKLFAKPALKEEPKPPVVVEAKQVARTTPAEQPSNLRFDGGKFGDRASNSATPVFSMRPDWSLEVEMKGDFFSATLYRMDDPNDTMGVELFDPLRPERHVFKDVPAGGKYRINFNGNGVWRVSAKQGSGKFD